MSLFFILNTMLVIVDLFSSLADTALDDAMAAVAVGTAYTRLADDFLDDLLFLEADAARDGI